jgi:hypothetical protein
MPRPAAHLPTRSASGWFSHHGQQRKLAKAGKFGRERAIKRCSARGVTCRFEAPDRLHRLAPLEIQAVAFGGRRVAGRDGVAAKLRGGKLPVIGRAELRSARIVIARVSAGASFCGPAQPVMTARERDRPLGNAHDLLEVACCHAGVVEEAQRVPAGVKLCVNGVDRAFGNMGGRDSIGALRIAKVEKLARKDAPFDPPSVAIDIGSSLARR